MKIQNTYTTSLETLNGTVAAILDAKLQATSPEGVADYIGFATDNIDAKIERAKQAKKDLDAYIKNQEAIKDTIKIDGAKWLEDCGLDRLDGMVLSSVTVSEPKPSEELVILNETYWLESGFYKKTLDKTAIKNHILNSEDNLSEFAKIETTHKENQLKINKRRN